MEGRCEYKYLLNENEAEVLRRVISDNIPFDENGGGEHYIISSLYFDDPAHKLYYQTYNREAYRYKLRLRVYGEKINDETPSFFEIKSKFRGRSIKKRLRLPLAENELLWKEGKIPDHLNPIEKNIARDILHLIEIDRLSPSAVVSYKRLAFAAPGSDKLRVTFDSELSIRTDRLDLRDGYGGTLIMPEGFCVLECKSNANLPLWLARLLSEHRLNNHSYSKYGQTPFAKSDNEIKYFNRGETSWVTHSAEYSRT